MATMQTIRSESRGESRWTPVIGLDVTCQRGTLGLGPNVALRVIDVAEFGIQLEVNQTIPSGEDVEITLAPPDGGRPIKVQGNVVKCAPAGESYRVGVRLRQRMGYSELWRTGRPGK